MEITSSKLCHDTDVFLLLLHHYHQNNLECIVLMEGTSSKRVICNIGETVRKHELIIPDILAAHSLTGSDTTAYMWGIGKSTVLKTLMKGHTLQKVGDPQGDISAVKENTLFDARYVWPTKT